ncbi:MAG TPA: glycerol-3-phosphate dehydrogenase/oxidase [Gemmatimonadales bacterium]|nr:glycerol-3-phosphate dehydrogenase/oxidase [Gemmatimonadales bacterium]
MQRDLSALGGLEFDVAVVGGGICGAAVAWDAAQRGLSVALLERGDFGEATSATSLKVAHGGIRYLQHLDLARVRESSRERSALLRVAPHLVSPMPVLVPAYGHGMQGPEALAAAFLLLNALTCDRNRGISGQCRVPRARVLSRAEALALCPEVDSAGLTGAGLFWDGQIRNPPRLVWEFVRTAGRAGAAAVNYCEVREIVLRGNRVVGVKALDRLTDSEFDVRARVVVNAAGPFAERLGVRSGIQPHSRIPLSRDLALVLARCPGRKEALALQTTYRDPDAFLSRGSRHLFLVPWRDVTLVGVHSAIYRGDPDCLRVTPEEVGLFLDEVNLAAPWLHLESSDVAMIYAGLLPIGANDLVGANVSFGKRASVVDNALTDRIEGLVTAVANRFTTARGVAERAVDLAARKLGRSVPPSRTAITPLYGAPSDSPGDLTRDVARHAVGRLDKDVVEQLAQNHGSAWPQVLHLVREESSLGETVGRSRTLRAEVVHAVREEMAQALGDCVFRRTDIATAGNPGQSTLRECAQLMARELGWSAMRQERELEEVYTRFPPRCEGAELR